MGWTLQTEFRIWHEPNPPCTPFVWPVTSVMEAVNFSGALLTYDKMVGDGIDHPTPSAALQQDYQLRVLAKHGRKVSAMLQEYAKFLGETPCVASQNLGLEIRGGHHNNWWTEWQSNNQTLRTLLRGAS